MPEKIDSHHHFWKYDPEAYGWIGEGMDVLKKDFLPADLNQQISEAGVDGVVSVQATQTVEETRWLIELAETNDFVRGVVGWVPLASPDVAELLEPLHASPWLKGVRHVVQAEPDDHFILGENFNRGVALLNGYDLVYDILIFARHLGPSIQFVDRHPDQPFVLDHIAKPTISKAEFHEQWARDIKELSRRENVVCKFSGVVTEVRDPEWSLDLIRPYWEVALESFGADRLLYGSDWPVCLLRTSYQKWFNTVAMLASELSTDEQAAIFGENAIEAYGL